MHCKRVLLVFVLVASGCGSSREGTVGMVPYFGWESSSVVAHGVRLHYWRTGGEGKPVLIMAHGITDYGLNWADLAAKFEGDYDVIMYDARGHGFSAKPGGPYDLKNHMEDLVGLIKALGIEKPILMGHSMGGSTVMLTAATYPDLPAAVIMEDPPMEEALEKLKPDILEDWKEWVTQQRVTSKQELMKNARTEYHPGWTAFQYDQWAESKHLVDPNVIDILKAPGFGNPREMFPKITAPALILKAEAESEEYKKRHLEAAALLPNGKLIHFQGAGHLIRNDKPAEAERAIRSFLKGLETN